MGNMFNWWYVTCKTSVDTTNQPEGINMKPNWGMIGVISLSIIFWKCVFLFGIFQTLIWMTVITALVGLYLNLTGRI
jgi:hypothetical protein